MKQGYSIRHWAVAEEPKPRKAGETAPLAPYALDNGCAAAKYAPDIRSTSQHAYAQGWSEESAKKISELYAAGTTHLEELGAAESLTKSCWDAPDWKVMQSTYDHDCKPEVLARHHRRLVQRENVSEGAREARWLRCFTQAQSKAQNGFPSFEVGSHVTGTDFSLLPAGYALKVIKSRDEIAKVDKRSPRIRQIGAPAADAVSAAAAKSAATHASSAAQRSARQGAEQLRGLTACLDKAQQLAREAKEVQTMMSARDSEWNKKPEPYAGFKEMNWDPEQRLRNLHGWKQSKSGGSFRGPHLGASRTPTPRLHTPRLVGASPAPRQGRM
jgi:hypothetical protein